MRDSLMNVMIRLKRDGKTQKYLQKLVKHIEFDDTYELFHFLEGEGTYHALLFDSKVSLRDSWMPRVDLPLSCVEVER